MVQFYGTQSAVVNYIPVVTDAPASFVATSVDTVLPVLTYSGSSVVVTSREEVSATVAPGDGNSSETDETDWKLKLARCWYI